MYIIEYLDENFLGIDCRVVSKELDYTGLNKPLGWFLAENGTHVKYSLTDLRYCLGSVEEVRKYVATLERVVMP